MHTQADLHVHSKHSDRPSEWLLRRIGAPESFVEPLEVYETCRARGLDFVTITDHNKIRGALEIAHLPGTFVSAEVTTYFPEDGCKIHCLVYDITEAEFAEIQRARESVYDLQSLLLERGILHSVAHPFFQVNGRFTPEHLEKLILLFNRFETVNGSEPRSARTVLEAILSSLTPEDIARMADRHGVEPTGPQPWRKGFTGGSDDHSGTYIGRARTVAPPAASVAQFLDHVRQGRQRAVGQAGASLQFAHSLYHIGYGYYRHRLLSGANSRTKMLGVVFEKLLPEHNGAPRRRGVLGRLIGSVVRRIGKRTLSRTERVIVEDFQRLFDGDGEPEPGGEQAGAGSRDRATFQTACRICHQFTYSAVQRSVEHARRGELVESVQALASLGPAGLAIAPYLAAFHALHNDEGLVRECARRFGLAHLAEPNERKAWLADGSGEPERLAAAVRSLCPAPRGEEPELTLITCSRRKPESDVPARHFAPVGILHLPDDMPEGLPFPPFLHVVEFIERGEFDELLISTPDLLGLTGLMAARLLGLKTTAVYHEGFCRVLRVLADDDALGDLAWQYMGWFLGQADAVVVPDEESRRELASRGLDSRKLRLMPRRHVAVAAVGS
jgi:hypothetical protein